MELKISNVSKKGNLWRTAMSQQSLVNALLSEKQPTNPGQTINNNAVQPAPVKTWGV